MSATLRTPALAFLALSLHSSRQLVLGSALSLTNASPAAALRLVGWIPLQRSLQDEKRTHQLRGSAHFLALRGGAGGDGGGSSSENISNISGLTDESFDTHTPSQFDAMDFTAEDMKGVPTGLSKEQVMKEMLEGRPDMLLPHNFSLAKANKMFNSPMPDENRSSSFSSDLSEHSGEYVHGIQEVRKPPQRPGLVGLPLPESRR